jgi:hypothetical protein
VSGRSSSVLKLDCNLAAEPFSLVVVVAIGNSTVGFYLQDLLDLGGFELGHLARGVSPTDDPDSWVDYEWVIGEREQPEIAVHGQTITFTSVDFLDTLDTLDGVTVSGTITCR